MQRLTIQYKHSAKQRRSNVHINSRDAHKTRLRNDVTSDIKMKPVKLKGYVNVTPTYCEFVTFLNALITDLHNNVKRDFPSIRQLDWCAFLDLFARKSNTPYVREAFASKNCPP